MNFASPLWQTALFLFAGGFLLWETWRGWKRGIVRSGIQFGAFVVSGLLGLLAWQATAFVADKIVPGYGLFAGAFAGSLVTLVGLLLMLFLGAILFKRTGQQPSRVLRLVYGFGGAFFGFLTGLLLVWGGITIIRAFGAAAQVAVDNEHGQQAPPAAKALLTLKDSLELGKAGQFVGAVDIVPPEMYETLSRVGKLTSDEEAMARFLECPGVQTILAHPRMAALINNPSVARAAEEKNYLAVMQNKALFDAVQDPAFQKLLMEFDLQKALDYAFPKPQPSPTPKNNHDRIRRHDRP